MNYCFLFFFLRTQVGGRQVTSDERKLSVRAAPEGDVSGVADGVSSAVQGVSDSVNGATQSYTDLLKNAGTTVMEFGSQSSQSAEEAIKAGGRATLAVGSLLTQLFNGLSLTVATGANYLSSGINSVDGYLGNLPIVGVITSGLSKVTAGLSDTVNEMSESGRGSRNKMVKNLLDQLNQGGGSTATSAGTSSDVSAATDGTTATAT